MRPRRRGGPGDWLAPLTALVLVVLLAWAAALSLRHLGYAVPWTTPGPQGAGAERAGDADRRGAKGRAIDVGQSSDGRADRGADDRDRGPAKRDPAVPALPAADPRTETTSAPPAGRDPSPGPPVPGRPIATAEDVDLLRDKDLDLPVRGISRDDLRSNFHEARGRGLHEAMDILSPRGTPVIAVEDGTIGKLFESVAGGLTIYLMDPTRTYAYYYAHLDRYAPRLQEGVTVSRGDVIGYVGTTGNAPADTPHLHFTIYKLGPEQRWWEGTAIDPYLVLR